VDIFKKQSKVLKALKKARAGQLPKTRILQDVFKRNLSSAELDALLATMPEVEQVPHPEKPGEIVWRLIPKKEQKAKVAEANKPPATEDDEDEIFANALATCETPYRITLQEAQRRLAVLRKRGMPWFFGHCYNRQDVEAMFEALEISPEEMVRILYETHITRDQFAELFDCSIDDANKGMAMMEERYANR
jgi:hypothetical protein